MLIIFLTPLTVALPAGRQKTCLLASGTDGALHLPSTSNHTGITRYKYPCQTKHCSGFTIRRIATLRQWRSPQPDTLPADAGGEKSLPLPWSCTDQALLDVVKQRDPSGKGLPSVQALRLLMSLLHWNPASRPTPQQACPSFLLPHTLLHYRASRLL